MNRRQDTIAPETGRHGLDEARSHAAKYAGIMPALGVEAGSLDGAHSHAVKNAELISGHTQSVSNGRGRTHNSRNREEETAHGGMNVSRKRR